MNDREMRNYNEGVILDSLYFVSHGGDPCVDCVRHATSMQQKRSVSLGEAEVLIAHELHKRDSSRK